MQSMTNGFYKDVAKAVILLLAILLLCRVTMGGIAVVVVVVGLMAAVFKKPVVMAICFILFPLVAIFSRAVVGMSGITLIIGKFSYVMMVVASVLSWERNRFGEEKLPVLPIFIYLVVASLSSINGWMPLISYLKILNFAVMVIGLYLLSSIMQKNVNSLMSLRAVFMAMAIIMILGSIISYFIPSVGFSMMLYRMESYGMTITGEELMNSGTQVLFSGMTCHSQMLSPVVACLATWVLCDMLLIERRVCLLHSIVLMCVPILLYMSRSRGGLLMIVSVLIVTYFVTIPKSRLSTKIKRHLLLSVVAGAVVLIAAAVYFEVKNDAISRWIRKTDNVDSDTRSLQEAFTGSRQQSIEMNLYDFKLNPLLGKGFQVVQHMNELYQENRATWYTAAVEKGVTPYVVLGETGLIGAFAFIVFLSVFYTTCVRRGYVALMTNFTCFLVANLADSTFFSPSGLGGFMWMVSCIGAFSTDCLTKRLQFESMEFNRMNAFPVGRLH